jgi:hypothetical protein
MSHTLSDSDRTFRSDFEAGRITPSQFDHRAHVRLAYVYLAEGGVEAAADAMRNALLAFLERNAIDPVKYHETLTRSWILAVRHFMERTPAAESADAFIAANPVLLDSKIMLTHYSASLLFSSEARAQFVEPDLQDIPRHDR